MEDDVLAEQIDQARGYLEQAREEQEEKLNIKRKKITSGDDLAHGVLKIVKVYLAIKRRIQPGDKMASSHPTTKWRVSSGSPIK